MIVRNSYLRYISKHAFLFIFLKIVFVFKGFRAIDFKFVEAIFITHLDHFLLDS